MRDVAVKLTVGDKYYGVIAVGSLSPVVQGYLEKRGLKFRKGSVADLLALASLLYRGSPSKALEEAFRVLWPGRDELEKALATIAAEELAEGWNEVAKERGLPRLKVGSLKVEGDEEELTKLGKLLEDVRAHLVRWVEETTERSKEDYVAALNLAMMRLRSAYAEEVTVTVRP